MRRALVLALIVALSGCAQTSTDNESKEVVVERNIFTGLPGSSGPVLAVKFDDTPNAHPQEGVEFADILFVTQVEAGLTRLMGIYSSQYPERLGPIRSARISDIDILAQFGRVGFIYSGAQSKLRPEISASNIENLSAERNPPSIYFNIPERNAPYAMMVKPNLLLAKDPDIDDAKSIGWEHGPKDASAKKILSAKMFWPNASYEAIWNKAEKRFLLNHDNKVNLATSGTHLGSPMMVIQIVSIKPSEYGDKFGGVTPKSTVTGAGKAYFLRNASMTEVSWSRPTAEDPTTWTLADGTEAYFQPGQVWFFLTDQEPEFTFPLKKSEKQSDSHK